MAGKWLEALKEVAPRVSRVAFLLHPEHPAWAGYLDTINAAAPSFGVAVVPSSCTIRVDRRYVPGETPDSCRVEIEELVDSVAAEHGADAAVEVANVYPLMRTEPDHLLVRAASAAIEDATGRRPALKAWQFGVNATFMNAAGIPSVGIGAGDERLAHTADERVPID